MIFADSSSDEDDTSTVSSSVDEMLSSGIGTELVNVNGQIRLEIGEFGNMNGKLDAFMFPVKFSFFIDSILISNNPLEETEHSPPPKSQESESNNLRAAATSDVSFQCNGYYSVGSFYANFT